MSYAIVGLICFALGSWFGAALTDDRDPLDQPDE
ncbi:hypothetical protein M2321_003950 [Rhodoblastus acidophilus]|nr:hypothetical protein [Rhodoblastus acidophilus]